MSLCFFYCKKVKPYNIFVCEVNCAFTIANGNVQTRHEIVHVGNNRSVHRSAMHSSCKLTVSNTCLYAYTINSV